MKISKALASASQYLPFCKITFLTGVLLSSANRSSQPLSLDWASPEKPFPPPRRSSLSAITEVLVRFGAAAEELSKPGLVARHKTLSSLGIVGKELSVASVRVSL